MQIRCYQCNKPFALSKETIEMALEQVTSQKLSHFNAPCPHCRKVNRVSRKELQRALPNWQPVSNEPSIHE